MFRIRALDISEAWCVK